MSLVLLFFAGAPHPASYAAIAPDAVARPAFCAAQQACEAFAYDFTEATGAPTYAPLGEWHAEYQDATRRAAFLAGEHLAFVLPPQPERTTPLAVDVEPAFVTRPSLHASAQQTFALTTPFVQQVGLTSFADYVPRAQGLRAERQQASTPAGRPERTSPLAADVEPALALRPSLHASEQQALGFCPVVIVPTFTQQVGLAWFPDSLARPPALRVERHQASTLASRPERTSPLAIDVDPTFVLRPGMRAEQQLAAPTLSPAPERTSAIAVEVHQDAVRRPALHAAYHLAVTGLSPAPERTSPIAVEVHADAVRRPTFGASQQLAVTELSPKPELTVALAWEPSFPDASRRPGELPSQQPPAFAFWPVPLPTGVLTQQAAGWAVFPDAVVRRAFDASQQLAASEIPPKPERNSPLAVDVDPVAISRPTFHAAQQLAVTERQPLPEGTWFALAWEPAFPDAARRSLQPAHEQPPSFAMWSLPVLGQVFYAGFAVYPDAVVRPAYLPARQQAFASSAKPERTSPLAVDVEPPRVFRPSYGVAHQLAHVGSPAPERTRPLAVDVEPPFVTRPAIHAAQQLAVTELSPQPEITRPLAWDPAPPELARRPTFAAADQWAFAPVSVSTLPASAPAWISAIVDPSTHMVAVVTVATDIDARAAASTPLAIAFDPRTKLSVVVGIFTRMRVRIT